MSTMFTLELCHLFYSLYVTFVNLIPFDLIPLKYLPMDTKGNNRFSKKIIWGTRQTNSLSTLIFPIVKRRFNLNIQGHSTLIFLTLVPSPYIFSLLKSHKIYWTQFLHYFHKPRIVPRTWSVTCIADYLLLYFVL